MKYTEILAVAAFGLLAYWYFNRARAVVNNLVYTIAGIANLRLVGVPGATLIVQVSNPTGAAATLLGATIEGNIILNGSAVLGRVNAQLSQIIPAGGSALIPVDFQFTNEAIETGLVSIAAVIGQKGVDIDFDGFLLLSGLAMPLRLNYVVK